MNGNEESLNNASPFLPPGRGYYYSTPYTNEQGYTTLPMTTPLPSWNNYCYSLADPPDPMMLSPTFETVFDGYTGFWNPLGSSTAPPPFQAVASTMSSTEPQHWTTCNSLTPATQSQREIFSPRADVASFATTFDQPSTVQIKPDCEPDPDPFLLDPSVPPPPPLPSTSQPHTSTRQPKTRKGKRKKPHTPILPPLDSTLPPATTPTPAPRAKKPKPTTHRRPPAPPPSDPNPDPNPFLEPDSPPADTRHTPAQRERNRRAANKCRTKTKAEAATLEAVTAGAGAQHAALRAEQAALRAQVRALRERVLGTLGGAGCGCGAAAETVAYVRNAAAVIGESGGRCLVWGPGGRGDLWPVEGGEGGEKEGDDEGEESEEYEQEEEEEEEEEK